jgi:hypothetical protein
MDFFEWGMGICLPFSLSLVALFFVSFLYILMEQIQNNKKSIGKSTPAHAF